MGVQLVREEDGFKRWVLVDAIRHWQTNEPHARATFQAPKQNRIELGPAEKSDAAAEATAKAWLERLRGEGWKDELSAEEQARVAARIAAAAEPEAKTAAETKRKKTPAAPRPKLEREQRKHADALVAKASKKGFGRALVERVMRPSIELRTRKATKADLAVGATRIGGTPDLPEGCPWPKGKKAPMVFVAQLDLAALAKLDGRDVLPKAGHLYFFASDFDRGAVLFAPPKTKLAPHPRPRGARFASFDETYAACGVTLRAAVSLPRELGDADDEEREEDAWYEVWLDHWTSKEGVARHRLLGHHFGDTEGIEPDDEVLLALDSDDRADMNWGDAGALYFVLDAKAAKKRDWTRVRVVSTD